MSRLIIATGLLLIAAPLTTAAIAQDTPAPTTPAPAASPAQPAAEASTNPLDQVLATAKPMVEDSKSAPHRLTGSTTKDCKTELALEGGSKLTIDLKTMQGMAVNTNLMVSGGGHGVQMEFDTKDGSKQAAAAEKAMSDMNDKCS